MGGREDYGMSAGQGKWSRRQKGFRVGRPIPSRWMLGGPILPEMVREKLATGRYDALTLIHNETSTGVMNPLREIGAVMREFPEVSFIVDTVSSMTGVKIETDALGIDVILAGIILAGLPETAVWALGLLVGINMLFGGGALIAMALAARQPA